MAAIARVLDDGSRVVRAGRCRLRRHLPAWVVVMLHADGGHPMGCLLIFGMCAVVMAFLGWLAWML
jgi:hypothetical protein